tara:strand:+ start:1989 stop:2414 length:426 start_codon:yes stop_codon:yes gene_type:complete
MKLLMILSLVVVSFASISNYAGAGIISATNSTTEDNIKPEMPSPQQRPKGPSVMHLPSIIDCSAPQNILEIVVGQFNEQPFVNGGTVVKRPDGVIMPALMTLYVNMQTGTYSLVAKFPEVSLWCIINSGGDFKPAVEQKAT